MKTSICLNEKTVFVLGRLGFIDRRGNRVKKNQQGLTLSSVINSVIIEKFHNPSIEYQFIKHQAAVENRKMEEHRAKLEELSKIAAELRAKFDEV